MSSDRGDTWTTMHTCSQCTWQDIAISGDGVVVVAIGTTSVGDEQVIISVDAGQIWTTVSYEILASGVKLTSVAINYSGSVIIICGKEGNNLVLRFFDLF